jgi:hypothetical protein
MTVLLDANVLIALVVADHVHHDAVRVVGAPVQQRRIAAADAHREHLPPDHGDPRGIGES